MAIASKSAPQRCAIALPRAPPFPLINSTLTLNKLLTLNKSGIVSSADGLELAMQILRKGKV